VRSGFARLTAEVALGRVGMVLGLEVSRLARNNADWHRLIDLAGLSDTLIGDADGIYLTLKVQTSVVNGTLDRDHAFCRMAGQASVSSGCLITPRFSTVSWYISR
jgi:hypothetical protein